MEVLLLKIVINGVFIVIGEIFLSSVSVITVNVTSVYKDCCKWDVREKKLSGKPLQADQKCILLAILLMKVFCTCI